MRFGRFGRMVAALSMLATLGACASGGGAGGLGEILGSVLGGTQPQQQGSQVSGTVTGVDTRNQQIGVQTSNGQTVAIAYDAQTKVTYQNQQYQVTSLERGDRVTARLQQTQNGGYYTDLVQVDQSVQSTTGTTPSSTQAQSFQGTVREVNVNTGVFTVNTSNYGVLTVSLPYAVSNADATRFRNLRVGETVRFTAVPLNQTRVELQGFY